MKSVEMKLDCLKQQTTNLLCGAVTTITLLLSSHAFGITYGEADCLDPLDSSTCAHRNVVSLSGFRLNDDNELVRSGSCTGSLLKKTNDMLVIITAGHCSAYFTLFSNLGLIDELGVSFDGEIQKFSPSRWTADQYVLGGKPLLYKGFGPNLNANSIQYDYGIVVFSIEDGIPVTHNGTSVDLTDIQPVTLPALGFLETLEHNIDTITNVGYGLGAVHGIPGEDPVPGGPSGVNWEPFGVRSVSESLFIGFMGKKQNLMLSSMNPAREQSGTCGGDSGGPQFVVHDDQELIVSVTSSGDSPCRATNSTARLDIDEAHDFYGKCGLNANSVEEVLHCSEGCTQINEHGICAKK